MSEPKPAASGPGLPMAALVTSVAGLCLPPLMLVSIALGVVGLLKARRSAEWAARRPLSQGALLVSGAGLAVFAVLVVPTLSRFGVVAKRRECSEQLYRLYAAQTRLHATQGRFTTRLADLDVQVTPGRFVYRLAPSGPLWTSGPVGPEVTGVGLVSPVNPQDTSESVEARLPTLVRESLGVSGTCPGCQVTLLCAGNLDGDETLDAWSISSAERTDGAGVKVAPGVLMLHSDDSRG